MELKQYRLRITIKSEKKIHVKNKDLKVHSGGCMTIVLSFDIVVFVKLLS